MAVGKSAATTAYSHSIINKPRTTSSGGGSPAVTRVDTMKNTIVRMSPKVATLPVDPCARKRRPRERKRSPKMIRGVLGQI